MRIAHFVVYITVAVCLTVPPRSAGRPLPNLQEGGAERSFHRHFSAAYHRTNSARIGPPSVGDRAGGIRELIADKYMPHYQRWKREFLSAEIGRRQWAAYEQSAKFNLTIVVSRDFAEGAGTGEYAWDESGQLVAATITLGSRINAGYPDPVYYPVMNSLRIGGSSHAFDANILAAAKIAHEFGHLTRMAKTDPKLYQLQSRLVPTFNQIFNSNGRNPGDPRLHNLAHQMGGTPVEIWEDREYWGEANAMLYLRDRFPEDDLRCQLFHRIKRSVNLYAKDYADRFHQIARSDSSPKRCGW